jgi:UDP-glucuronate decarboxylase
MTGSKSQLIFNPLPQDDPVQRKPDIELAKTYLKWGPEIALDQGLSQTIDYFKSRL